MCCVTGKTEQEGGEYRLYDLEVLELSNDVSFLLVLPPVECVCNSPFDARDDQSHDCIYVPVQAFEMRECRFAVSIASSHDYIVQEAFEKCWAHSPLRAAARRLFYIAIHQVSLLSHAACASMSTTTSTTTTTRDRGDRYGPMELAQLTASVSALGE